jgi:hypothetical protein
MKRIALLAALSLTMFSVGAQSSDEPSQVCDAAKVGFYLPDDAQVSVDKDLWVAVSSSEGLVVMMYPNDAVLGVKDLTDKNLAKACAAQGIKNYKFIDSYSDTGLVCTYGQGNYKKDGKSYDGFFGILDNSDIKNRTFFVAFMVPSLKDKATYKRILDMVDSMVPME